ncbi:MAG TPA: hypothetical protein PLG59_06270 [bacterium]|nr:hypothetical protein [bacterium]HQO34247.1 hypothetical protein [bacterium]HQP99100.1 hypothetical protein [bacterium]
MPSLKDVTWMTPKGDPTLIFGILGGLAVLIVIIVFANYRYRRWKKHQRFVAELNQLALGDKEGNTLIDLVKRYAMDEPVEVLYSLRAFDALAEKEMCRILGLQGSQETKQQYIDLLYSIRQKTYFPDMTASLQEPVQVGGE